MGTCCADHVTPLYPQKLALTSLTGGGRSVGIVRVRTKATEFMGSFKRYIVVERHTVVPQSKNRPWPYFDLAGTADEIFGLVVELGTKF